MTDPPRIIFLLGKPPRPSSVFPGVLAQLDDLGVAHRVLLPHEEDVAARLSGPGGGVGPGDLLVHRGLDRRALDLVRTLLDSGADCVNHPEALRTVAHHETLVARLTGAGLAVPASVPALSWQAVLQAAAVAPGAVVVKRTVRGRGRGAEVVSGTAHALPGTAPFEGPFTVEAFIPNDGLDRKLYVIGDQVSGLLKPSPLRGGHVTGGETFEPDLDTTRLALRVADVCGLPLCGVDLLPGADGPVVIDVNPFPGYRGVPDVEATIARYLAGRVQRVSSGAEVEQPRMSRRYDHMDDSQARHDLSDAAIGDPAAYLPEKSTWVADQLRAIDAAGDTRAATIQDRPIMVITMRGARSGMLRRVPLMRVEHEGAYAAVASKGGAPEHPAWFHNLVKHADVLVHDGTSQHALRARLLEDGPERDAWWERCVAAFPSYAEYQENTERQIPVFLLEPLTTA
ncbi:nitroreductase/quinone reductase family protein [Serinicoccus sp. LYQ131]|uniref:nitroreductase/quinone reductase family protein n=1 Tax=Serinicoccus sp. LYQ131 TaxID=3378797 RepID=UPI00385476C9